MAEASRAVASAFLNVVILGQRWDSSRLSLQLFVSAENDFRSSVIFLNLPVYRYVLAL